MNITTFTINISLTPKERSKFCIEKLKEICINEYGFDFEDEDIHREEHGKPYFINNTKLHFNISHSKEMGVIVVDESPCGVDVELLRKTKYNVADRFFTEDEKSWINQAEGDEKIARFFKVWTGKEAYTKMLGCGLTVQLNTFSVLSDEIKEKLQYIRKDDYIICVCRN